VQGLTSLSNAITASTPTSHVCLQAPRLFCDIRIPTALAPATFARLEQVLPRLLSARRDRIDCMRIQCLCVQNWRAAHRPRGRGQASADELASALAERGGSAFFRRQRLFL
jgi:hypothetical protein